MALRDRQTRRSLPWRHRGQGCHGGAEQLQHGVCAFDGRTSLRSGDDSEFPPKRFSATPVENELVSSPTMRPTLIVTLVLAMLGVVLWLAAPAITGRPLDIWEACVV